MADQKPGLFRRMFGGGETPAPVPDDDRWPPYAKGRTVRQCLGTVLDEEWAHHRFCARDLDKLDRRGSPQGS